MLSWKNNFSIFFFDFFHFLWPPTPNSQPPPHPKMKIKLKLPKKIDKNKNIWFYIVIKKILFENFGYFFRALPKKKVLLHPEGMVPPGGEIGGGGGDGATDWLQCCVGDGSVWQSGHSLYREVSGKLGYSPAK